MSDDEVRFVGVAPLGRARLPMTPTTVALSLSHLVPVRPRPVCFALPPAGVHALSSFLPVLTFCVACLLSTQLGILRDDGVPIGLSLHECMLMAAVFSAADEVATLSLIKQVRGSVLSVSCLVRSTVVASHISSPRGADQFSWPVFSSNEEGGGFLLLSDRWMRPWTVSSR